MWMTFNRIVPALSQSNQAHLQWRKQLQQRLQELFHILSLLLPASASTPPQDELGTKDTPLAPHTSTLCRSMRTSTLPQRLIEQI